MRMKFGGVRISTAFLADLLRSSDRASFQRLDDLRQLWAWRLRLGRRHLSEAEHDIHVVAAYAEHVHAAASYAWDSEEQVGHISFLETNAAEAPRLERMLLETECDDVVHIFGEALAIIALPSPLPVAARDRRIAVETVSSRLTTQQRIRIRELDNKADRGLPPPWDLADKLLAYAVKHENALLIPERTPPTAEREPIRLPVDPNATWESVCHLQPLEAPTYSPRSHFEPGNWLVHPSFGPGYVLDVHEQKMRVLFATGERKLAALG